MGKRGTEAGLLLVSCLKSVLGSGGISSLSLSFLIAAASECIPVQRQGIGPQGFLGPGVLWQGDCRSIPDMASPEERVGVAGWGRGSAK